MKNMFFSLLSKGEEHIIFNPAKCRESVVFGETVYIYIYLMHCWCSVLFFRSFFSGGGDRRLPVKIYVFNLTLNDQLSSDIRGRAGGFWRRVTTIQGRGGEGEIARNKISIAR